MKIQREKNRTECNTTEAGRGREKGLEQKKTRRRGVKKKRYNSSWLSCSKYIIAIISPTKIQRLLQSSTTKLSFDKTRCQADNKITNEQMEEQKEEQKEE